MCLILVQIHSHIFNLTHRIRRKTNNKKTEELPKNIFACLFSVHNTISVHVTSTLVHDVINLLHTEELLFETNRLLLTNLDERVLVNNLLEYLYNAKIRSSDFGCFRAKMVKIFFIFTNLR